jgi:hypothetical protein
MARNVELHCCRLGLLLSRAQMLRGRHLFEPTLRRLQARATATRKGKGDQYRWSSDHLSDGMHRMRRTTGLSTASVQE